MKVTMHENGWTPIVTDLELENATDEEINALGCLSAWSTIVPVIDERNKNLSVEGKIKLAKRFGDVEQLHSAVGLDSKFLPNSDRYIVRVTGELDEHGKPGLFPFEEELPWHVNDPGNKVSRFFQLIMHGISGMEGSVTGFLNVAMAYDDYLQEFGNAVVEDLDKYNVLIKQVYNRDGEEPKAIYTPLIATSVSGRKCFFIPPAQSFGIYPKNNGDPHPSDLRKFAKLKKYNLKEKYMYHHQWKDGDVLFSNQEVGFHRRLPFEGMKTRMMHRLATRYEKINLSSNIDTILTTYKGN